jgi:hypothetical protein
VNGGTERRMGQTFKGAAILSIGGVTRLGGVLRVGAGPRLLRGGCWLKDCREAHQAMKSQETESQDELQRQADRQIGRQTRRQAMKTQNNKAREDNAAARPTSCRGIIMLGRGDTDGEPCAMAA